MSIDTERLATDRVYWDSVAPEGATHYDPEDMGAPWMMETTSNWMFYWGRKKEWVGYAQKAILTRILARLVIRPTAREEWIDGLPPVGVECEVNDVDHGWISATVIAHDEDEGVVVCKTFYGYDGYGELRPIRTPEQREQEALALSIQNAFEGITRIKLHDEKALAIAGILMDQGYRKADDK